MALVQIRLHSVLCWGRLITRDGVEREKLGQSFALLCLACERALFMKSGKLMLFLTTSGISPVLFLLLPHTHIHTSIWMCVCGGGQVEGNGAHFLTTSSPHRRCFRHWRVSWFLSAQWQVWSKEPPRSARLQEKGQRSPSQHQLKGGGCEGGIRHN